MADEAPHEFADTGNQVHWFWGKLNWDIFPFYDKLILGTFIVTVLLALYVVYFVIKNRYLKILWTDWLTSVDHKKIGIMYMVLATVMLVRGFADAILMRTHQALASAGIVEFLPGYHYDQVFTAHGVIMIFFVAMPFITGFMNYIMPLQIGARDVAFPFLNNFSFWLTFSGVILIMLSLFVGEFSSAGWLAFPPLSGLQFSPGVGMDYYLWSLNIAGIGTTLSGINLIVTIVKMRAPGMTWMRLPIFTWSTLVTNILIVASFPVLTATLALLTADRYLGTHFFTSDMGGNPMMYVNLIWIWGHPEVYILILPLFGIFSEIVSTFSSKRLFGYTSMVYALCVIMVLSYLVWLHHFFTMGAGADVNSFFGITTMIISIPTGAKLFNWLFTMYKGRIRFELPMVWTLAFMVTFTIGGMTGVLLAVPPADYVLHNSLFLVAHFHNVIIGGVVFGVFAGITYWWPKAFGFHLNQFWGKVSIVGWVGGFYLAFMPLYILGLMGVTRRLSQFEDTVYGGLFFTAALGSGLIAIGLIAFIIQIVVSIRDREKLACGNDPWGGRTLEWATTSPPPQYNFAFTPQVYTLDAWHHMKENGAVPPTKGFIPIHMPHNTSSGIIIAGLMTVMGFGLVWHIWWLVVLMFLACLAWGIGHTFNYNRDYYIPADQVAKTETGRAPMAPAE